MCFKMVNMVNMLSMEQQKTLNGGKLDNTMLELCRTKDSVSIVAAWNRDVCTKEKKLMVSVVYPDGECSPIHEYAPSKITVKGLSDLGDLDGLSPEMLPKIFEVINQKKANLPVQNGGSGACSMTQVYHKLCHYVLTYEQPGVVFVSDGYGNIHTDHLQSVLDKLAVGHKRLTVQKNFKAWQLLRASDAAGHPYAYKINRGNAKGWYFSFKLPEQMEAAQDEATKEVA